MSYIISIDQSTQGTKGLLLNGRGEVVFRCDRPHAQIVNEAGWVSHDGNEIYHNVIGVIGQLMEQSGILPAEVKGLAITNQRETSLIWDRASGEPLAHAVVWQCSRASAICERRQVQDYSEEIAMRTGLQLSPYFPAAKIAWLLENTPGAGALAEAGALCMGTVDTYLVHRLTGEYKTDYSNASRTQLFHIFDLTWDGEICRRFGIDPAWLPEVTDSNSCFGYTTCEGMFPQPIPVHAVMGDSHAALFGQNCRSVGRVKATYGTGSSIMMNIGSRPVLSSHGLVTSLAWGVDGAVDYVLEGNLNYTGAVITWLKDQMGMIGSPAETAVLAQAAHQNDGLFLVPAFSGLGAPYWNSEARAAVVGMDRTTGRAEFVRAALESIAYQIADVVFAMKQDSGLSVDVLRVDGGPTGNRYLMQFQSDILQAEIRTPAAAELSAIGVGWMAGLALGLFGEEIFQGAGGDSYTPAMPAALRDEKYAAWQQAVGSVLDHAGC